ncbi:MAG: BMC domain-containing protein [Deltaproteobacteria bacterium]|jgi:ethanolamine utilization protein EutK|nr:BMC domain-containing protein [Deltaproteobacteria bacterium]
MDQQAQGFVETAGLVIAIQVADVMAKAAKVKVVMAHKVDGLRVCVICEGDVAACQASVSAGAELARGLDGLLGRNVIPRPVDGSQRLQEHMDDLKQRKAARKAAKDARRLAAALPPPAQNGKKSGKKNGKKSGEPAV